MPENDSSPLPPGYEIPNLSGSHTSPDADPANDPNAKRVSSPDLEPVSEKGFKMKPMGQEFIDGEKKQPAQAVQIDGQSAEVREKVWLREKANEQRAARGQGPVSDEAWEKANVAKTEYMTDQRAAQHQVKFEQGVDANGQSNARMNGDSVREGESHIFVMDKEGEVFAKQVNEAHTQQDQAGNDVHVHHSSFKSGEAVAGAGEFTVDDKGFVKEITDRSGHYRPGEDQTSQTLDHLEDGKGVNLDNTKFTLDRGYHEDDKTRGMAKEYLQGKVTPEELAHRQEKIDAGADIDAKPSGVMEQTFKNRHNVADDLKEKMSSVRDVLDHDAERRDMRVYRAEKYLEKGVDYEKVAPAAAEHAQKDEHNLKPKLDTAMKESMPEKKSVREALGSSLGSRQSQASQGQRLR